MRKVQYIIIYIFVAAFVVSCDGNENGRKPQASDTLYTEAAAMAAHATQPGPERALLIIDSAEIVGNLQPYDAQVLRARVYCQSYDDMRLDSAIIICEQLMEEDSVRMNDIRAEDRTNAHSVGMSLLSQLSTSLSVAKQMFVFEGISH